MALEPAFKPAAITAPRAMAAMRPAAPPAPPVPAPAPAPTTSASESPSRAATAPIAHSAPESMPIRGGKSVKGRTRSQ